MEGNRNGMQWWIDVRSSSPSSLNEEGGVQEAHMTEEGRMGWLEGEGKSGLLGVGSTNVAWWQMQAHSIEVETSSVVRESCW
jgi:hypothetical protein